MVPGARMRVERPSRRARRRAIGLAGAVRALSLAGIALSLAGCDGGREAPRAAPATAPAPSAVRRVEPGRDVPAAVSPNAYGHALSNLPPERWDDVREGKALFITTWVAPGAAEAERLARGPGSKVREGLGPLFNATSCQSCHFKDGRGGPPPDLRRPAEAHDRAYLAPPAGGPLRLLRLGVAGGNGEPRPEPTYGWQLQDRALPGHTPEGSFAVAPRQVTGRHSDGTAFTLEAPVVEVRTLAGGPLHPEVRLSLRLPPSLIGLGLLEAVPEAALLALADPEDADGDGLSGRPNRVTSPRGGAPLVGRFGWKAGQPSLRLQNATALHEDLGVSTSLYPEDSALGATLELSDADLEQLTRYTRLLEPPARRDRDAAQVLRGESLFTSFGCAGCHRRELTTGDVADLPELSRRCFEPYTDLLLHDLGDGLADDRPEGAASGREWRTAPLWGLGLLRVVSGEVHLLHDGRARTIEEAILWHGGEAQAARDAFSRAPETDRVALLRFLDSL